MKLNKLNIPVIFMSTDFQCSHTRKENKLATKEKNSRVIYSGDWRATEKRKYDWANDGKGVVHRVS